MYCTVPDNNFGICTSVSRPVNSQVTTTIYVTKRICTASSGNVNINLNGISDISVQVRTAECTAYLTTCNVEINFTIYVGCFGSIAL